MDMFQNHIYEDNQLVVFETRQPVEFSILSDSAFNKAWSPWERRYFALRNDATLVYRKTRDSAIIAKLDLSSTKISKLALGSFPSDTLLDREMGIIITCKNDGLDTNFRCILKEFDLIAFTKSVQAFIPNAIVDSDAKELPQSSKAPKQGAYADQSFMRQSLIYAMDKHDHLSTVQRMVQRRGALQWLPALFQNDLIHGSWWFVIGSVCVVVFSTIIVMNSYRDLGLGEDDSNLTRHGFRAVWGCMIASGAFFTLGSLAFVRAMFETPPMRPLFTWYHVSSDELLGSWLFLLGCIPFIPYCMVYLAAEQNVSYLGAFVVSILLNIGVFLFVLACYPGQHGKLRRIYIKPIVRFFCCCCLSERFIEKHFYNDWLAGTWILFWGNLLACLACLVLSAQAALNYQILQTYTYITAFIETFLFLIGSAYFVAGSFPPAALEADHLASKQNNNSSNDELTKPMISAVDNDDSA